MIIRGGGEWSLGSGWETLRRILSLIPMQSTQLINEHQLMTRTTLHERVSHPRTVVDSYSLTSKGNMALMTETCIYTFQ